MNRPAAAAAIRALNASKGRGSRFTRRLATSSWCAGQSQDLATSSWFAPRSKDLPCRSLDVLLEGLVAVARRFGRTVGAEQEVGSKQVALEVEARRAAARLVARAGDQERDRRRRRRDRALRHAHEQAPRAGECLPEHVAHR